MPSSQAKSISSAFRKVLFISSRHHCCDDAIFFIKIYLDSWYNKIECDGCDKRSDVSSYVLIYNKCIWFQNISSVEFKRHAKISSLKCLKFSWHQFKWERERKSMECMQLVWIDFMQFVRKKGVLKNWNFTPQLNAHPHFMVYTRMRKKIIREERKKIAWCHKKASISF